MSISHSHLYTLTPTHCPNCIFLTHRPYSLLSFIVITQHTFSDVCTFEHWTSDIDKKPTLVRGSTLWNCIFARQSKIIGENSTQIWVFLRTWWKQVQHHISWQLFVDTSEIMLTLHLFLAREQDAQHTLCSSVLIFPDGVLLWLGRACKWISSSLSRYRISQIGLGLISIRIVFLTNSLPLLKNYSL